MHAGGATGEGEEAAAKEREIGALRVENAVQEARLEKQKTVRTSLLIGVVALAVVAVVIGRLYRRQKRDGRTIAGKNAELEAALA